ncbi:MAG: NAD-dependent epimerase/dehydratase family protein [Bacteroidales bacterium]|nr:NAD-dependent epimerase/dehydratase family protein [Bacteroidales bacterium]
MKTIGITGANGHVGANLVRRLIQENYIVRVLQYHSHEACEGLPVEIIHGDLNDPDALFSFCKNLDVVIHLAARITIGSNSYESVYKVNVGGTQNLVEAAQKQGVRRMIHFSSIHALEHEPQDQPMDESRLPATGSVLAYEKTKAIADEWVMQQQSDAFNVIVLNPTAIVGPNDFKPSLLGQMLIRLYDGFLPGLIPGGYDWVDVRDVSDAAFQAIEKGKGGERYILSGTWKSVADYARLAARAGGKEMKKIIFPLWVARLGLPFLQLYSKLTGQHPLYTRQSLAILQQGNRFISHEKATKELGFNPRPLEETLRDTVRWMRENKMIKR